MTDPDLLHLCFERSSQLASRQAFVGLDGFVDRIVKAVDKRSGPGDAFRPIPTLTELSKRIGTAAGRGTNIELFLEREKVGGNGPIFAQALLASQVQVKAVGAFGKNEVHPVFEEFVKKTKAVSLCDPGITHALEFEDGKLMLGMMSQFEEITYDHLVHTMGEGALLDAMSRANLIALVNWTMIPHFSQILSAWVDKLLPNLGPTENRVFFFDPADPEKRPESEYLAYLEQVKRFHAYGRVVLSVNGKEAEAAAECLGVPGKVDSFEHCKKVASDIRQKLEIECVTIHGMQWASCATRDEVIGLEVPHRSKPVISTGAGDHFDAGFSVGELLLLPPSECLKLGVLYSGYYVRTGKSPSLGNIEAFLKEGFSLASAH